MTRPKQPRSRSTARRAKRHEERPPRSADEFFARSARAQERWTRATHAVTRMRNDGISLSQALRENGVSRDAGLRLIGSAVRRQSNGRYVARRTDRLLRVLAIPAADGMREIAVRDSRTASAVSDYYRALKRFTQRGDSSRLADFAGTVVTDADGVRVPLLTDLAALQRLGDAGVLSFESIYGRTR